MISFYGGKHDLNINMMYRMYDAVLQYEDKQWLLLYGPVIIMTFCVII